MGSTATSAPTQRADEGRTRSEARWTALALLITASGAVLRFYHLGARVFWIDEALSIAYARLSFPQFLKVLWAREINMALYYLLLRGWIHLGSSEAVVRGLSAVAGTITVPLIYRLGRRLYDAPTGALAALLLAFNAFAIRYSQEARAYSLVALLVTASTLLLVEAVERRTQRAWTAYAICSAAAVYAHVLALLVVGAHALWLISTRDRPEFRTLRRTADVFVLLILPLAVTVWHAGPVPVAWIAPTSLHKVAVLLARLAGGEKAALVVAALWLCAVVGAVRGHERRQSLLVFLWLLVPISVVLAVSLMRPMFLERYLLLCAPAAALATAAGVRALRSRPAITIAVAAVVVVTALSAGTAYSDAMESVPQDFRAATDYVLRETRPGDALIFYPIVTVAGYELYRGARPGPPILYPSYAEPYRNLLPEPLAPVVQSTSLNSPRVFLYLSQVPLRGRDLGEDVMRAWLAHHYRVESDVHFQNMEIVVFTR